MATFVNLATEAKFRGYYCDIGIGLMFWMINGRKTSKLLIV